MSNIRIEIWEKPFDLQVNYDCFEGEELLENQILAIERFNGAKIDVTLEKVKKYCCEMSKGKVSVDEITNVFKFIMPTSVFVPRNEGKRIVAIMCDFKFDIEHGIGIVFENEEFRKIVSQDELL